MINRDRWQTLEPLLDRALDMPDPERAAWLTELRASSPEIARELDALLSEDAAADRRGFLAGMPNGTLEGMQLGAYTLEQPLGHGGMGTVWLARRTDGRFEGKAAVKILNLALLSAAGQERFRREGSMLARLTHSGIGRLLDAGVSPSGQPYLVLEHVDGTPIDEYVRGHALPPARCVDLFLRVLAAVGHAHANLVVHRDLKPSNILVTADGSPKLLDFGIAKLLVTGTDSAAQTIDGTRACTPQFAAPEQLDGGAITTATDVYALGVLLYLLLAGRHPGEAASRLGLGDLDTVLARAMRRPPDERYQTVAAFADDLRRWLHHEPVSARPDSYLYRVRKFLRRHAAAAAATVLVTVLTGGYLVSVIRDRERVRQALAEATLATQKAEQVTDFAVGLFEPEAGESSFPGGAGARELLARGVAQARELSGQPTVQAQMLDLIGRIYAQQGDFVQAKAVLAEALEIRRKALGGEHPDVATSLLNLGWVTGKIDAKTDAVPLLTRALEMRRRHFGNEDERTADAIYKLGSMLHMTGNHAAARPLFDEWIDVALRLPSRVTAERAGQLGSMAHIARYSGRLVDSERLAREALSMERAMYGENHPRVSAALVALGGMLDEGDKLLEADSLLRQAIAFLRSGYPEGNPALANALRNHGYVLNRMERWHEAEQTWREAVEMYRRFVGENSLAFVNTTANHCYALTRLARSGEAVPMLRKAIAIHEAVIRRQTPVLVRARLFLGYALLEQGTIDEAEQLLLESRTAFSSPADDQGNYARLALESLIKLYEGRGDRAEAAKYRAMLPGE